MTQKQAVLQLFKNCGGVVTTAQFNSFKYLNKAGETVGLSAEYRRAISQLRRDMKSEGKTIQGICIAKSKWEYRIVPIH